MEIAADFRADLCELCRDALQGAGYKVRTKVKDKVTKQLGTEPVEAHYFVIQYFNVEHRFILPKPRAVVKHSAFACPEGDAEGLRLLLAKVEGGGELMRHASTKIMEADYPDALLNDWYIHHFHLGTSLSKSGFVKRTRNVLFARVTQDALYCIDVRPHGKGIEPWAQQDLLRVVHENWPTLLERGRLHDALGVVDPPSDQAIQQVRNAGIIVPVQMPDGTVYAAIGGGYATSRDSRQAVRRAMLYLNTATRLEKWLRENIEDVRVKAAEQGKALPIRPHFQLMMDAESFYAADASGEIVVRLGPRP